MLSELFITEKHSRNRRCYRGHPYISSSSTVPSTVLSLWSSDSSGVVGAYEVAFHLIIFILFHVYQAHVWYVINIDSQGVNCASISALFQIQCLVFYSTWKRPTPVLCSSCLPCNSFFSLYIPFIEISCV